MKSVQTSHLLSQSHLSEVALWFTEEGERSQRQTLTETWSLTKRSCQVFTVADQTLHPLGYIGSPLRVSLVEMWQYD